jgi:hypothetical protein
MVIKLPPFLVAMYDPVSDRIIKLHKVRKLCMNAVGVHKIAQAMYDPVSDRIIKLILLFPTPSMINIKLLLDTIYTHSQWKSFTSKPTMH